MTLLANIWNEDAVYTTANENGYDKRKAKSLVKSIAKKIVKETGGDIVEASENWYEGTIVLLVNGQHWYVKLSDCRHRIGSPAYFRTMEHSKDWRGGMNHNADTVEDIVKGIQL